MISKKTLLGAGLLGVGVLFGAGVLVGGASAKAVKKVKQRLANIDTSDLLDEVSDEDAEADFEEAGADDTADFKGASDADDLKFDEYDVPDTLYDRLHRGNPVLTEHLNVKSRLHPTHTVKQGVPSIKGTPIAHGFSSIKPAEPAKPLGAIKLTEDDLKSLMADLDLVSVILKSALLAGGPEELVELTDYQTKNIEVEATKVHGAVDYYDFKVTLNEDDERLKTYLENNDLDTLYELHEDVLREVICPLLDAYATPYSVVLVAKSDKHPNFYLSRKYRSTDK